MNTKHVVSIEIDEVHLSGYSDPSRPSPTDTTRRIDSLVHGVAPMTTLPGRVIGAKPAAFCRWIFDLLGAAPGDSLDDLFPGSGAITRAWTTFTSDTEVSCEDLHDASHLPADTTPHP